MNTKVYTITITQDDVKISRKLIQEFEGSETIAKKGLPYFSPGALAITRATGIRMGFGCDYAYLASEGGYNGGQSSIRRRFRVPDNPYTRHELADTFTMYLPILDDELYT